MPFVIITPQGKSRLSAAGLNLPTLWLKRKSERRALNCCDCAPRGKPNTKPQATVGFSLNSRKFFLSVQKEFREHVRRSYVF